MEERRRKEEKENLFSVPKTEFCQRPALVPIGPRCPDALQGFSVRRNSPLLIQYFYAAAFVGLCSLR